MRRPTCSTAGCRGQRRGEWGFDGVIVPSRISGDSCWIVTVRPGASRAIAAADPASRSGGSCRRPTAAGRRQLTPPCGGRRADLASEALRASAGALVTFRRGHRGGGSGCRAHLTVSLPFIPRSAWSPTVQIISYSPGCEVDASTSWSRRPGRSGVPPTSSPPFTTRRSWASEPSFSNSIVDLAAAALDGHVARVELVLLALTTATGWPSWTVAGGAAAAVVVVAAAGGEAERPRAQGEGCEQGAHRAADNMRRRMPTRKIATSLACRRRSPLGATACGTAQRRARRATSRPNVAERRRAVPRALQRLPHAQRGRRARLEADQRGRRRRAHERPELQRPQGEQGRRPVRDPQRRLLRRDHAREHRRRPGRRGRRRVPRRSTPAAAARTITRAAAAQRSGSRAGAGRRRARPEADPRGPGRRARRARAQARRPGAARRGDLRSTRAAASCCPRSRSRAPTQNSASEEIAEAKRSGEDADATRSPRCARSPRA